MRKILVVNRLGIGDVVLTTPLAELLKARSEVMVGFIVAKKSADLLVNHPYIDDVFAYDKREKVQMMNAIKEKGYQEAILVDERFSSMLLAWKLGCKILNQGFEITIGKQRLFKRKEHAVRAVDDFSGYIRLIYPELVHRGALPSIGGIDANRSIYVKNKIESLRASTEKIVLIVPRSAGDHKNWKREYFGEINQYLNDRGIIPLYIGAQADYNYIENIDGKKINVAGEFTLRELPELAKYAAFAISACTGPMHILSVSKIPLIVIYGPTDPKRWAPDTAIVVQSTLPCVPCLQWAGCPREKGNTCMDEIMPEKIKKIIEEYRLLEN